MQFLRVFAGGLPKDVAKDELLARFSKFGKVSDVEIKNKTDATGEWMKTFAYMNMETSQQNFNKCKSQLNNTTWRNGKITVQLAKQSTSDKYACERNKPDSNVVEKEELTIPMVQKGAVPGTAVPDHENWVVTKFQRVVPVMNVRTKDKKKVIRYDPSKHSHQIKRLDNPKDDVDTNECVGGLTWSLGEENSVGVDSNYRKRTGDFSGLNSGSRKKLKPGRNAADVIAAEQAKKASYVDDLEIVTSGATGEPQTTLRSEISNQGIDLSKFDSDSDNETGLTAEKPSTNFITSAKRNRTKIVVKPKAVSAGQSSDSSESDCETAISAKRSSAGVEINGVHPTANGGVSHNAPGQSSDSELSSESSDSSSTDSDTSSSCESSASDVNHSTASKGTVKASPSSSKKKTKTSRKAFPGTAALSNDDTDAVKSGHSSTVGASGEVKPAPTAAIIEGQGSAGELKGLSTGLPAAVGNSTPAGLQMALLLESAASILRSAATAGNSIDILAGNTQLASLFGSAVSTPAPATGQIRQQSTPGTDSKRDETISKAVDFSESDSSRDSSPGAEPANTKNRQPSISSSSSSSDTDTEPETLGKGSHVKIKAKPLLQRSTSSSSSDSSSVDVDKKNAKEKARADSSSSSSSSDVDSSSDSDSDSSAPSASPVSAKLHIPKKTDSQSASSNDSSSSSASSDEEPTKIVRELPPPKICNTKKEPKKPKVKDGVKKKPVISVAEKRDLANQRRLEALAAKKSEMRAQKQAMSASLSNTDAPAHSKKIVFEDSDEEIGEKVTDAGVSRSQVKVESKPAVENKVLFESSGEEEEGEDYDKMFAVKAQFEGDKGTKLLHLQNTFNDDSRFKLTEKFMDSESDSSSAEEGDPEVTPVDKPELDGEQERRKNLQILQSIVGSKGVSLNHPTSSQSKTKKLADTPASVFRDISSMHFDPTSESHEQLVKKVVPSERPKKSRKKKLDGSEPVVGSEPAPQVSKERFFEVNVDLASSKAAEKGGSGASMTFNFLANDDEPEWKKSDAGTSESGGDDEPAEETEVPTKYKSPFADMSAEARFNDVSEGESDEGTKSAPTSPACQLSTNKDTASTNTVVDWFLFKPDDIRLVDGAKRFCKTLDEMVLRRKWEELRPKLVDNYLLKSKRAVRKLGAHSSSVIKKRFAAKHSSKVVRRRAGKPK